MNNYDYPEGSDTKDAPWNASVEDLPEEEIEVTVSITLSKTVTIAVTDYDLDIYKDEDGHLTGDIDYSNCDLKSAVRDQIILPNEAYGYCLPETKMHNDLEGWNVDDFEVIKD